MFSVLWGEWGERGKGRWRSSRNDGSCQVCGGGGGGEVGG